MTATVIAVAPSTTIAQALDILSEQRISCLVVTDAGKPVGIVTERDIVKGYDTLARTEVQTVSSVMTAAPITVPPDLDHFEAFKLMKEQRIRHLVVQAADGTVAGVVTETDFVRHLGIDFYVRPKNVHSVMAPVITAAENCPLPDVLTMLARPGIYCVVIERGGIAVGILTERDAVRLLRQRSPVASQVAGDVMGKPLHTISPDVSLLEVSDAFRRLSIRHLVVVDEKGGAKGVVSEHEIVQGLESEYVGHLERIITEKNEALSALGQAHERLAEQSSALSSAIAELESSHEELREFARVASHDLAEPSRLVVSFCQLLLKRYGATLGDDGRELAGFAIDGALRMRRLVHDLAVYATPPAEAAEQVEVGRVARAVIASLDAEIKAADAHILLESLPRVFISRMALQELYRHLISNALVYHREGVTPEIRLGAADEGDHWRMWVADNGIGIEPSYHQDIFRLFTRLHPQGPYAGTGAGLAICRRIVNGAGGHLWVESTPGRGSEFFFTLPKLSA